MQISFSLYTYMFDNDLSREHSQTYHSIEYSHFSHNETLNNKQEQEYFLALIDQRIILNDSPSRMHNVESPSQFKFLEHAKSQFDNDNPIFQ